MSIKVTTQPQNRISINIHQQPEIKTVRAGIQTGSGSGAQYFRALNDVNATVLANNETVVYDAGSDRFVVKELPIVNGGTF